MAEDVQPMGRRATMQDWRTFPYFLSWIAENFFFVALTFKAGMKKIVLANVNDDVYLAYRCISTTICQKDPAQRIADRSDVSALATRPSWDHCARDPNAWTMPQ